MGGRRVKRSSARKDPLLPETRQNVESGSSTNKCWACGRFILHMLPILGCLFVLMSLFLLTYKLGVPITEDSISSCLANYTPKVEVLIVIFLGATLIFIVTVMRNIQINVYHQRQKSESKCQSALNLIASICNILAYTGFVLLALYDLNGPGKSPQIHYTGAIMYFTLSCVYGHIHSFLLCKQTQYPMFCKVIFTILPIATTTCTIIYVTNMEGEGARFEYEWFAVALAAINIGLLSVLFCVDSVDDELRDFFCCRRGRRGGRNSRSNQGIRTGMSKELT